MTTRPSSEGRAVTPHRDHTCTLASHDRGPRHLELVAQRVLVLGVPVVLA